MKIDEETIQAAGLTTKEVEAALSCLSGITEAGKEGRENRIAFLRALAGLARENDVARAAVVRLLDGVGRKLPEEAETFRAYYLEGNTHQTARQVGRRLCMDVRTVYSHNRRVLKAMLPLAFGIDGLFLMNIEG